VSWTEEDSALYRDIAPVAVPHPEEMLAAMIAAIPREAGRAFRLVELGSGDGRLASALLTCFPHATLLALDGSALMRAEAAVRLARFGSRVRVAPFDLATLDWWDVLAGADVVASSLVLHHLNDAKKRYLYKAIGDRISATGALIIADLIRPAHPAAVRLAADTWDWVARRQAEERRSPGQLERFVSSRWNVHRFPDPADQPSALFHHLVWLKHAGFAAVDCWWSFAGHAVFGGYKSTDSPDRSIAYEEALTVVRAELQS
jgi:tRNA (cmo5U34)-methyltransferase